MDFIEKTIGLFPDGGSRSFEILLFLIPVLILGAVFIIRMNQRDSE